MNEIIEIAEWLNNADGMGATDEEFAGVFALLGLAMGRGIPKELDDIETIIANTNYDEVWRKLNTICREIQININDRA